MAQKDILLKLREIVKTPHPECMILPFGNSPPEEVIKWIISLSDKEFDELMNSPIIVQAKIFYTKIRKEYKNDRNS